MYWKGKEKSHLHFAREKCDFLQWAGKKQAWLAAAVCFYCLGICATCLLPLYSTCPFVNKPVILYNAAFQTLLFTRCLQGPLKELPWNFLLLGKVGSASQHCLLFVVVLLRWGTWEFILSASHWKAAAGLSEVWYCNSSWALRGDVLWLLPLELWLGIGTARGKLPISVPWLAVPILWGGNCETRELSDQYADNEAQQSWGGAANRSGHSSYHHECLMPPALSHLPKPERCHLPFCLFTHQVPFPVYLWDPESFTYFLHVYTALPPRSSGWCA